VTTWAAVHAGDVVLGYDHDEWLVVRVDHDGVFTVTVRNRAGHRTTARPDPSIPVTIVRRADHSDSERAFAVLAEAFPGLELLQENAP
jgi:hypothetical protein